MSSINDQSQTTIIEAKVEKTDWKVEVEYGKDLQVQVDNGARGKSAYEVWLDDGNSGTVRDFLNSLSPNSYIHKQATPLTEWVITHELDRYPSVTVVDSGYSIVYGEVEYISKDKVKIKFSEAFAGKSFLN